MLIRICLIIAILAGLAAGTISFLKVKDKIDTVATERDDWNHKYVKTDADLTTTKGTLAKTEKELTNTKETLVKTEAERAAAVAESETQTKKATELAENLTKTIHERDDAKAELAAYVATGYTPKQIAGLGNQIKAAQEALDVSLQEKQIIQRSLNKAMATISNLVDPDYVVRMNPGLRGKILVADPKWEFVVVNVGEDQGAELNGELLVSREGRLVAKVIIKDVQKGRSIANVIPGWKLADVTEGDQVIPAHPKS